MCISVIINRNNNHTLSWLLMNNTTSEVTERRIFLSHLHSVSLSLVLSLSLAVVVSLFTMRSLFTVRVSSFLIKTRWKRPQPTKKIHSAWRNISREASVSAILHIHRCLEIHTHTHVCLCIYACVHTNTHISQHTCQFVVGHVLCKCFSCLWVLSAQHFVYTYAYIHTYTYPIYAYVYI